MASRNIKKIIIVILNLFLYFLYGKCIIPIIFTSLCAFFLGKLISKNKNFFLVFFTYLIILMPLVFYKYIITIINVNLLVPLGISYYTLILLSYISDIYHNRYNESENIIDFLLFCLYFPCLFIGPINKYNDFIKKISNVRIERKNVFKSLFRICLGLIKKLIIANKLGIVILTLSTNLNYQGLYILIGCIIYSVYLYCDFSGGIDIILGISNFFNIELVENFDKPYLSETVKEFWRRWHISLGTWLKDYIYIPLGGNRNGFFKTKLNIIFTFFVSGIWHGLHYILWGIINGILVAVNFKSKNRYLNIFLTFFVISILWVFFIYNDTFLSIEMLLSIFKVGSFNIWNLGLTLLDYVIVFIFLISVLLYELNDNYFNKFLNILTFNQKLSILLLIIFLILLFGNYGLDVNSNNFVYGNF